MHQFIVHCSEPTFRSEPEAMRQARLDRILAIIRRELPNILLTSSSFSPYNEVESINGEGDNGTYSRVLRKTEHR
jgi:hypothetical protein